MSDNPASWQPDPSGAHEHRFWDGSAWTDNVADAGVASTDPYVAPVAAPAPPPEATTVDTPVAPAPSAPPPDPTAPWPAAGPAAPAPPPAYVPTAGGSGGGSKKGLLIGAGILVALALGVGAAVALGGGDSGNDAKLKTELAAKFKAEGDISEAQAVCVADIYLSELGADAFKGLDLSDPSSDPPADLADEFNAAGAKAVDDCNIDLTASNTTETTDTTFDDGSSDTTDTTFDTGGFTGSLPPNFEEILASTYESTFNLSSDKAKCLAHALAGAIEDGSMSESEAMGNVLNYLSDCDISLEEIGAN